MTAITQLSVAQALRRAAVRATLAPSVHNTQPWRLVLNATSLELLCEPTRQLQVLDPNGRQMRISCGGALFNARVALAAAGYPVTVERLPDPTRPTLLARLTVSGDAVEPGLAGLDAAIEQRRTNRRQFTSDEVPEQVLDKLAAAAAAEGALLRRVTGEQNLIALATLTQRADALQTTDPAYRAEVRAWTTERRDRLDGVPVEAVPHSGQSFDDIPIRSFDIDGHGGLPAETHSSIHQTLLLLATPSDNSLAWLRAGEALEHTLLEITEAGLAVGILSQIAEVPAIRALVRAELGMSEHPHLVLRVGQAPATPATRRRRLADVLVEHL